MLNKRLLLRGLTAIAAIAAGFSTGDIETSAALWILAVKEVAVITGDFLDDGKRNNSFRF